MKVYYSAGIGEKCKGKIGKKQVLNWRFKHLGKERIIPCLYRFKEGIVFDVLTLLDEEEILGFINKYENCDEDMMSINQQREIEQEHPYQELSLARIEINGQHCNRGYSSTGSLYMPFFNKDKKLKLLQKEYKKSLGNHTTFACQRFCVPYGEDKTPRQRLKQREGSYRINTLRIITHEEQRFYPIEEQIELSKLVSKGEIKFNHPMTQVAYKLSIQLDEEMVLPEELGYGEALYAASATYETQPELTEHEKLEFEATLKYERQPEDEFAPTSSGSIGIIGGASGPINIFIASKDKQVHHCFSMIQKENTEAKTFLLQGINIKINPRQVYEYSAKNSRVFSKCSRLNVC